MLSSVSFDKLEQLPSRSNQIVEYRNKKDDYPERNAENRRLKQKAQ
jgi:hypothetical protein